MNRHRCHSVMAQREYPGFAIPFFSRLLEDIRIMEEGAYEYRLHSVESTNDFLRSIAPMAKDDRIRIAFAQAQTQGRGQRGTNWRSRTGENVLFSGLFPVPLIPVQRQFDIAVKTSILLIDFLRERGVQDLRIKWPNDILAGNRKLAGILIENSLQGKCISRSLIGIGLNVNQTEFGQLNRATSMQLETGSVYSLREIQNGLSRLFCTRLSDPLFWAANHREAYKGLLYAMGEEVSLVQGSHVSTGVIAGVTEDGRLIQRQPSGRLRYFVTKEVSWNY